MQDTEFSLLTSVANQITSKSDITLEILSSSRNATITESRLF